MKSHLAQNIRNCDLCQENLPLVPKPIFQFTKKSKILIVGQAPGLKAHESGIPWNDKSGERLRQWLGVTDKQFYDPAHFAIVPMGLCYPGKGKSGDLPPRPECSQTWMRPIKEYLTQLELEIYIGKYACEFQFGRIPNLTSLIKSQHLLQDHEIVLPHPSPRNNIWLAKNSWFESDFLPLIQEKVARHL